MLIKVILLVSITLASCKAPNNSRILKERMYNEVKAGAYDNATITLMELHNRGHSQAITQCLTLLFVDAERNSIDFANELWYYGKSDIATKYFPDSFFLILEGKPVKLIFKKNNLALTLGAAPEYAAFGSEQQSNGTAWRFIPFRDNQENRLYFKIINNPHQDDNRQLLNLASSKDSFGEHKAYGSGPTLQNNQDWYLRPVKFERKIDLFFIYNREFEQGLKLRPDSSAAGNQNDVSKEADVYGWTIEAY